MHRLLTEPLVAGLQPAGPLALPPPRASRATVGIVVVTWDPTVQGVLRLPSGRLVRGRGLGRTLPDGPVPTFAVYLLGEKPPAPAWEMRWLRWPDFGLPSDQRDAMVVFREAWRRAEVERVELACWGGRGRTGTALACLAVLDGVSAQEAVAYVRENYDRRAVETPRQKRYVARFAVQ
jgi:hypothetical protein